MTRDDVSKVNEISSAIGKDRQTVARWIDEVERIRSEGGVEFRPTGRAVFADEAGSSEWQTAKDGGSKVELIRIRAGDTYPLPEGFEDLSDEDVPERFRRWRQAALDRQDQGGKGEEK